MAILQASLDPLQNGPALGILSEKALKFGVLAK